MTMLETLPETKPTKLLITQPGFWIVVAVLWIAALATAFHFDTAVATWVQDSGHGNAIRESHVAVLWKFPGTFYFTLIVITASLFTGWIDFRDACFVFLAGLLSGINIIPKWMIGRIRPYKMETPPESLPLPFKLQPFYGGIYGFFHQKDLSFPSGHECTAFALAAAMAIIRPKWMGIFYALAIAVAVERVCENAHYCSDVVAAPAVATIGVLIAFKVVRPLENPSLPSI